MFTSKSFKTESKIALLVAVVLLGFGANANVVTAAPNLLDGITLDASLSAQDIVYLESSLQMLYDNAPDWYDFVEQAKPFSISVDLAQGAIGREAISSCCDADGRGTIVFGHSFGESLDADTPEARQVVFIGTLVHECAHVNDARTGRLVPKTDFKSCVAVEKSGLDGQLQVKRALAVANLRFEYQRALDEQIAEETTALGSRELWDFYCGAFNEGAY